MTFKVKSNQVNCHLISPYEDCSCWCCWCYCCPFGTWFCVYTIKKVTTLNYRNRKACDLKCVCMPSWVIKWKWMSVKLAVDAALHKRNWLMVVVVVVVNKKVIHQCENNSSIVTTQWLITQKLCRKERGCPWQVVCVCVWDWNELFCCLN